LRIGRENRNSPIFNRVGKGECRPTNTKVRDKHTPNTRTKKKETISHRADDARIK